MSERPRGIPESGIKKVFGVAKEDEAEVLSVFEQQFYRERRFDEEVEKPKELVETIAQINERMAEFMTRFGVGWLDIPPQNIHAIDRSRVKPETKDRFTEAGVAGRYIPSVQQIAVLKNYASSPLEFSQTVVHEMLHANSFQSLQPTDKKSGVITLVNDEEGGKEMPLGVRRVGFGVVKKDGTELFRDLDEAVIQELTVRFDQEYFSSFPALRKETELRNKLLKGRPDLRTEVSSIEQKTVKDGKGFEFSLKAYSYPVERARMNKLLGELSKTNPEKTQDDIFNLFVSAVMKGELLPIARLIEKSFGKGSFRTLGESTKRK